MIVDKNFAFNENDLSQENFDEFCQKGFLVEDYVDEVGLIYNGFKETYSSDRTFKLTINPTLNCNFRCWYCYETHNVRSAMSNECLKRVMRCIDRISKKYRSLELAFFGGEPLMQYSEIVKPLIEYVHMVSRASDMQYQVTFTTNGFLISDEIIDDFKSFNIGVSQITLDGGPSAHNKTRVSRAGNSYEIIVANIIKMASAGFPVILRVNVTKENIKGATEIVESFKSVCKDAKRNINVLIQQVWQDAKNDILDEIWSLYSEFLKIGISPWRRRFNFYSSCCYADMRHSAVINHDGKIFKCTAIDFDQKSPDGELQEDGGMDIDSAFDARLKKRKENQLCKRCRILPVCNGGCSKNVDQAGVSNYCLHPTDDDKNKVVKNIIREQLHMSRLGISWKD